MSNNGYLMFNGKHYHFKFLLVFIICSCCTFASAQCGHDKSYQTSATIVSKVRSSLDEQLFKQGLYWNPQRPGWGINITRVSQSNGITQLVAVIYTYRPNGTPVWYLASAPVAGSSWNAPLYEYFWNGKSAEATNIGSLELEFKSFDSAIMHYSIHNQSGSEEIKYFEFNLPPTQTELTALWYPPSQPGRGLTLSTIGNKSVAIVYHYDDNGKPIWLIGSLKQSIQFGTEISIPVDFVTGYCLYCTTTNTQATRAGSIKLTFNSESNAQLVTDNIPGWTTTVSLAPLSDISVAKDNVNPVTDPKQKTDSTIDGDNSPVMLQGTVLDITGSALAGALIRIADTTVFSSHDGHFKFPPLARKNAMLTVIASGYRREDLPVFLNHPAKNESVTLDPIILSKHKPNSVRMLFGGDMAFGRRFLDPNNSTPSNQIPADDPNALIQASNPGQGTREIIKELRPWYQEADFGVVNLETPVTDNPITPHLHKAFRFFTLPRSVSELEWLGVDYVSLGNNHVYDYLEQGLIDSLENLDKTTLGHSGAGVNSAQAFAPYRTTLAGSPYALLSMTSVTGNQHPVNYVADDIKGGAANLTKTDKVITAIQNEHDAGYIPIVQYHTGKEYTFEPTKQVLDRMQLAADNDVPLLITHHPHVAAGVGLIDNMVAVLGLGNLAFDQARLETMLGLLARVDMKADKVEQLRLLPVYLENFAPQRITGRLASNFLRRIGEFSHAYGALVYPYNGQGWVDLNNNSVRLQRTVKIDVTIPESGSSIIDLRNWAHLDESLLEVNTTRSLKIQMGRDLFGYGDFEDWDTDSQHSELPRWDISGKSRYLCNDAYKGVAALCTKRDSRNLSDSVTANRNRIRVMGDALDAPNKNLSLFGYYKGKNAGPITIQTRYYASAGEMVFGKENAVIHPGGDFDWQPFSTDLNMPAEAPVEDGQVAGNLNARALRIFIRHAAPDSGYALASFDEIAVISWEDNITNNSLIETPHAKDFLRVSGTPGQYQLELTFSRRVPVTP